MYLLLQRVQSRSLRGSVPLYAGDPTKPHHIVLATPQAVHVVPITYTTGDNPQLQFTRQKTTKINDAVERVWPFRPPLTNKKADWQFQKSCHEIDVALPSMFYVIERKRWAKQHCSAEQVERFQEGFLLLTSRHELCLYGIDPETMTPTLASKLDLLQPQLRRHPHLPLLTIDPSHNLIILSIYEGQFEYICLNPAMPFILSSSMPFRTVEMEIRAICFLHGTEAPTTSTKRRTDSGVTSRSKIARRTGSRKEDKQQVILEPPASIPTLAMLYSILPEQAVELRLQNLSVCQSNPLRLRVVEFGTSNILSTEDMAGPAPLELSIKAATAALIEIPSESAIAVVGGRELQMVQWHRREWGPGAHCELDVRLAEVECWDQIDTHRWLISDCEGTLLSLQFGGPEKIQSRKLTRLTPAMDVVSLCKDVVWLGAYLGSSYVLRVPEEDSAIEVLDELDNLAPILDFLPEPFTVVAGGWRHQGGLRIIQHGVKAVQLAHVQEPVPYCQIFEINLRVNNQLIVGMLARPLGPSALLSCSATNGKNDQLTVDVKILQESPLSGLDLTTPTIALIKTSTHFWQLTQQELRQLQLHDMSLVKANAVPELGHCVGATAGAHDDLWVAGNVSADLAVVLQVTSDFASKLVHHVPYPIRSLCAGASFVAVGSATEPFVELFSVEKADVSRGRIYLISTPSKTLIHGLRDQDPPNPIAVALCAPRTAASDATSEALLISSSSGDLLSLEAPLDDSNVSELRPIKRTLGPFAADFAHVSPHQVMALGALPVLVSCDLSGVPSWRPADLPEGVTSLCAMDWPELAVAAAARATEVPVWYLDGSRRLGLGLLDREPQGCESSKTVCGFCVEHLTRDKETGVYIAAGLELTPIREKLDATAAPSWSARKETTEDNTIGCGALVLLRSDTRAEMEIEQAIKFDDCEVPTALNMVSIGGTNYVAVGTTFEHAPDVASFPSKGAVRIVSIVRDSEFMGTEDSAGQSTNDEMQGTAFPPGSWKLKLVAEKEFRGSVQAICGIQDLLMVAVHNRIIGLRLREATTESPNPTLAQISTHVMYNYVVDMVPFGPNHLLVGDSQRSCGLVQVTCGRGGVVQVTEVAHDFNGVPVLSVAQMDESTIVLSDDQKHLWVLKASANKDSMTHCGRIRVNEQINRMRSGVLEQTRLHSSDSESRSGVFSLFRDEQTLPVVQWASCEGSLGVLIPIANEETAKRLELLIKIISEKAVELDGLDPTRGRSILLNGRELPARAILDGTLLSWALRQSISWQRKLHEAFVEQSILSLGSRPLSFDEFRSQLEQVDLL